MKPLVRCICLVLALTFVHWDVRNAEPALLTSAHDPFIMRHGEFFYLVSTGKGIPIRRSKDLIAWQPLGTTGRVFTDLPPWTKGIVCLGFSPARDRLRPVPRRQLLSLPVNVFREYIRFRQHRQLPSPEGGKRHRFEDSSNPIVNPNPSTPNLPQAIGSPSQGSHAQAQMPGQQASPLPQHQTSDAGTRLAAVRGLAWHLCGTGVAYLVGGCCGADAIKCNASKSRPLRRTQS